MEIWFIIETTKEILIHSMAMAGKITIAEVEELVPAGSLDLITYTTGNLYSHRIFQEKNTRRELSRTVKNKTI